MGTVSSYGEPPQDVPEAVSKKTNPDESHAQSQPLSGFHGIGSPFPDEIPNQQEKDKREQERDLRDTKRLRVEKWSLGVGIVGLIFFAFTLCGTIKQIGVMQEQLIVVDRPWIKLVDVTEPRIIFVGPSFESQVGKPQGLKYDQAELDVVPEIKNIGRSVATHVNIYVKLVLRPWGNGWGDFQDEQKEVCDWSFKYKGPNMALFPDESFSGIRSGSGEILTENHITTLENGRFITPALVGCVGYRIPASSSFHYTGFVYEIFRADNRTRHFMVGQDTSPNQVLLIRNRHYDYAD